MTDRQDICDTLRNIASGSVMLRLAAGSGRSVPASMLIAAVDEIERLRAEAAGPAPPAQKNNYIDGWRCEFDKGETV